MQRELMIPQHRPGAALLYHDIVPHESAHESGIVTDGSWRYKLPPETFREHLRTIDESPYEVTILPDTDASRPLLLTFDDGGVSCAETAATLLQIHDMKAHFFIITGRLGDDGYLTCSQIQQLADAGHHIGSHTVTHANLRELSSQDRRWELRQSKQALEELLGAECVSVSIPGGFADEAVIDNAFDVGYDYVFVSEPRYLNISVEDDTIGRWNVWHNTTPTELRQILDRAWGTRLRIQGRWYALKTVKRVIGHRRFQRLRQPFVSRD